MQSKAFVVNKNECFPQRGVESISPNHPSQHHSLDLQASESLNREAEVKVVPLGLSIDRKRLSRVSLLTFLKKLPSNDSNKDFALSIDI